MAYTPYWRQPTNEVFTKSCERMYLPYIIVIWPPPNNGRTPPKGPLQGIIYIKAAFNFERFITDKNAHKYDAISGTQHQDTLTAVKHKKKHKIW